MAEGRQREAWNHTAQLLALIYNVNRDPKGSALKPVDFHPMGRAKHGPAPKIKDLGILKDIFVRRK